MTDNLKSSVHYGEKTSIYFWLYEIKFSLGYQVTHKIVIQRQYVEWEIAKYGIKCVLPVQLLLYWLVLECVYCICIKNNECIHYKEWFKIKHN